MVVKVIKHLFPGYLEKQFLYQYLAALTATLAAISSGMHFGWPSSALPKLLSKESSIFITSSDGSWLAVMPSIGAPIGSIVAALIVDKIGRKFSILIVSPFYFIAWIAIAFLPNLTVFYIARVMSGVMDGITFITLPMYIGEIANPKIRGLVGCSISITFVTGFLLTNILGVHFSIKTAALLSCLVPLLHFTTFIWMPESPYYYLLKGNSNKAALCLKQLTRKEDVGKDIKNLQDANEFQKNNSAQFLDLFKNNGNIKRLVVTIGLRLFQQFSGSFTITFYCLIILNEAGGSIESATASNIYFSVQIVSSIVSSLLVDKIGRRPLLIVSLVGSGIALALEGTYFYLKLGTVIDISKFGVVPLIALILFNVSFNIGLNTIPVLILGEFFAPNIKAFALCVVNIFFNIFIIMASKFFQIVKDGYGMYVPFFTFAMFCLAGVIFTSIYVPETKGKTLEEIQIEFNSNSSKRENIAIKNITDTD